MIDRAVDSIARELNLDAVEVRRINLIPGDEMPYDMGMLYRDGQPMVYDSGNYPEQLDQILEMVDHEGLLSGRVRRRRTAATSASPSPPTSRERVTDLTRAHPCA